MAAGDPTAGCPRQRTQRQVGVVEMDHEAVNALREPRIAALVRIPDHPAA